MDTGRRKKNPVEGTYTHTRTRTITPAPTQPHAHINKHTNKHTIAQPISCPHFPCRQLSVKCNEITEIGAFSLCHALDQCPTLYNLDLQGNMIGCEAVDVFLARKSTQVLLRNFVCLCLCVCVCVSACAGRVDAACIGVFTIFIPNNQTTTTTFPCVEPPTTTASRLHWNKARDAVQRMPQGPSPVPPRPSAAV